MIKKKCTKCSKNKTLDSFYKNKNFKDGRSYYCKDCVKKDHKIRAEDPVRKKDMRNNHLRARYGITIEGYEKLMVLQDGLCAICKKEETQEHSRYGGVMPLAVDHNHFTGEVRGLLCSRCNRLLGRLESSREIYDGIISYVGRYNIHG